ncbi:MAG: response regulator [Spirochaetes bacterium]|jgi:PAS domain S-box-containing protein|nr:response regulator [Spirochaetota bacterium]
MSDSDENRRRILLVEDEAVIALSEKRTIQAHGFNVTVAHSGVAAVDAALGDARPDLILMDIDLGSGIDGTEAAQQILSELSLPIVFLTSHTEKDYVDRVRDITNYGYVIKHSGEFVLIESIRMALELFNAHWERDSIVRLTQELIVRLDQSERWTFVNDRACEFFGKPREELLGQHFMDYVHPEDIATVRDEDRRIARSHQSVVGSVNRQKTTRGRRTGEGTRNSPASDTDWPPSLKRPMSARGNRTRKPAKPA